MILSLLVLSLFRNNIFIAFPFLIFTNAFKCFIQEIKNNNKTINLIILIILSFLLILNLYQFLGYIVLYKYDQENGGLLSNLISNTNENLIERLFYFFIIFIKKIFYLISARESIAINNYDYFIAQKTTLFSYPFLINLGTSLYLFIQTFRTFIN